MNKNNLVFSILALSFVLLISSCKDDDPVASVTFTASTSNADGDVTGDGGSTSNSTTWANNLTTASYDMDITASAGGSMNLTIVDADGTIVANETLVVGVGDDTKGGVTTVGTAGDWTITVTLTNFNGDGSFSVSKGS